MCSIRVTNAEVLGKLGSQRVVKESSISIMDPPSPLLHSQASPNAPPHSNRLLVRFQRRPPPVGLPVPPHPGAPGPSPCPLAPFFAPHCFTTCHSHTRAPPTSISHLPSCPHPHSSYPPHPGAAPTSIHFCSCHRRGRGPATAGGDGSGEEGRGGRTCIPA